MEKETTLIHYYPENEGTARTFRNLSTNEWYYESELTQMIGINEVNIIKHRFDKDQTQKTTNMNASEFLEYEYGITLTTDKSLIHPKMLVKAMEGYAQYKINLEFRKLCNLFY